MIATIPSAVLTGVVGRLVSVEVHVSNGLPGFTVVGLPDAAVRESRDRVRAALLSSGLPWPLRRVTVNLAPSGIRKQGAGLDLPIAVGVVVAAGELEPSDVDGVAFVGELGLDGSLRGVPGTIALAEALGGQRLVVPTASASEAVLAGRPDAQLSSTLRELVDHLRGRRPWVQADRWVATVGNDGRACGPTPVGPLTAPARTATGATAPDLGELRGQLLVRRALEASAAGGHHLVMVGPPGTGKTMAAACLPGLLPDLDPTTALEVTRVHSVAGLPLPPDGPIRRPPFRAPHHTASAVSMIGGGSSGMRPGEISLAHGGVLFLDEMGEFPAPVLDALRQPLEDGEVRVSRAAGTTVFPARFLLVAAMNPCPCGQGGPSGSCRCPLPARDRYLRRLSGPLLDRFDLAIPVDGPEPTALLSVAPGEPSSAVAARVASARERARQRGVPTNAELRGSRLDQLVPLDAPATALIGRALRSGSLTARGFHRVRRLARTLADLDGADDVGTVQVREALLLRSGRARLTGEHR